MRKLADSGGSVERGNKQSKQAILNKRPITDISGINAEQAPEHDQWNGIIKWELICKTRLPLMSLANSSSLDSLSFSGLACNQDLKKNLITRNRKQDQAFEFDRL